MSIPEFSAYQEARAALIHEDRYLRRDTQIIHSDAELKADQMIRDIRTAEASTIWKQEYDSILHPFPGMEFLTGIFVDIALETNLLNQFVWKAAT
jgi:adenosine deaminase CECR1